MSIALELEGGGRKLGRVCDRSYRLGPNCPLVLRESSEDLLTANVFGVLRHIQPALWMTPMLREAFPAQRIPECRTKDFRLALWKKFPAPASRSADEGQTEVDVHLAFGETVVFIEAKYGSPLSPGTEHDPSRDQVIRLLDVAYANLVDAQFFPCSPLVLVIGPSSTEPELVTRYRERDAVLGALPALRARPDGAKIANFLADRVGYLSWRRLADILSTRAARGSSLEAAFLVELAGYARARVQRLERAGKTD